MENKREYTIHCQFTNSYGAISNAHSSVIYDSLDDKMEDIAKRHQELFKDDPNYKLISIYSKASGDIDWELNNRMQAIRSMCELGRRVRADAKIRNRQPLSAAYIFFSDQKIHDHMVFIDSGRLEYAGILADELNVLRVEFVEGGRDKFFNYDLKPNFRILGPKGYGKNAQTLKEIFSIMSVDEKNALYLKLKAGDSETLAKIPLTIEGVEVVLVSKQNYISASGKVGAIILDTFLDDSLIEKGLVAEFRSALQNMRKVSNLELTDRIFLEVFCPATDANILGKYLDKMKKDLLATDIKFFPPEEVDIAKAHEFSIDDKKYHAHLYREE